MASLVDQPIKITQLNPIKKLSLTKREDEPNWFTTSLSSKFEAMIETKKTKESDRLHRTLLADDWVEKSVRRSMVTPVTVSTAINNQRYGSVESSNSSSSLLSGINGPSVSVANDSLFKTTSGFGP